MLTNKQKRILRLVVDILKQNNIPFQITGGLAAIAYGSKRSLFDMYLITLQIEGVNVDISQVQDSYFKDKLGNKVKLESDTTKAKIINLEGITIPVQDKNELIAYKKILARGVDLEDIEQCQ